MPEKKSFKFNILAFVIAFALGIFYVYFSSPAQNIVVKYPTPYNSNKIVYKGLNDECYKFKTKEVKCTDKAIDQPIV
jgi:hypothetical protein